VRRFAVVLATGVLLAGPTVLALYSGGYYDGPRSAATIVAWAIVFLLAVAGPRPLPASRPGIVAVAGLAGLIAWVAISVTWAPLTGVVVDNVQRGLLYLGVLLAAVGLFRHPQAARAVEPGLGLGAAFAILYGLSERLLPGVIEFEGSYVGSGRLELPITYHNAQGLLAAVGLILCVRVSGDVSRERWLRSVCAVAAIPLGTGIYLSYSRGALAVTVLGLIVLLAAVPVWPQLRAAVVALLGGAIASACAAALPGVASADGGLGAQERDGAIMFVVLVAVGAVTAWLTARAVDRERAGTLSVGRLGFAPHIPAIAVAAVALCIAGLVGGGLLENADRSERTGATPSRLASLSSLRYEFWGAGVRGFEDDLLIGHGSGSFRVVWRTERTVDVGVNDVHSIFLEQAVELGLVGLALFGLFVGGVAAAARRALRFGAPVAAGATAACLAWILHAAIDWDWQLPGVTLPAVVLAGALLAASEGPPPAPGESGAARRDARRVEIPA
jgi:O-antigen ligase